MFRFVGDVHDVCMLHSVWGLATINRVPCVTLRRDSHRERRTNKKLTHTRKSVLKILKSSMATHKRCMRNPAVGKYEREDGNVGAFGNEKLQQFILVLDRV